MAESKEIRRHDRRAIVDVAKSLFIRSLSFAVAMPFLALGCLLYMARLGGIRRDFSVCRSALSKSSVVPTHFADLLIISEDHRNRQHLGIDPISIIRVLLKSCYSKGVGGASTIEQQFVRVVLNRYEKSLSRKLYEQMMAVLLVCTTPRDLIAKKYLEIAYFGTGKVGLRKYETIFACPIQEFSVNQVIGLLARLKYPEPRNPTAMWYARLDRRCSYIQRRIREAERVQ